MPGVPPFLRACVACTPSWLLCVHTKKRKDLKTHPSRARDRPDSSVELVMVWKPEIERIRVSMLSRGAMACPWPLMRNRAGANRMEGKRASSERMTTAHKGPGAANTSERDTGTPQTIPLIVLRLSLVFMRGCPPSDWLWYTLRTA